ncbi:MAG: hypothetical protein ACR652_07615 [Methylocystis sp.]|uniref:hypothetical protein n=1 Tax=Methylocystis sp. TaxID=1911079 RepID=UPI003DA4A11A
MKSVRFLKTYRMYQVDEIAGFSDAEANALIAAKVAVDATPLLVRAAAALGLKRQNETAANAMAGEK